MKNTIFINGDIVPFANGNSELYDIANLNNDLNAIDKTDLKELIVDINSFGGDVTTGFAMANILKRFASDNSISLTTRISGYCSSIGTVIFLAGDKRIGNEYADFFVHNAWTFAVGDKNEMKKQYENLEEVDCEIIGNRLNFVTVFNWNGHARCELLVSDGDIYSSKNISRQKSF
jgi:ATP-dependent protease ClpP protease subunit